MIIMFLGVSCGVASKVRGPVFCSEVNEPNFYPVVGDGKNIEEAIEQCYYNCQDRYQVTADTIINISKRVERTKSGLQIIVNGTAVRYNLE